MDSVFLTHLGFDFSACEASGINMHSDVSSALTFEAEKISLSVQRETVPTWLLLVLPTLAWKWFTSGRKTCGVQPNPTLNVNLAEVRSHDDDHMPKVERTRSTGTRVLALEHHGSTVEDAFSKHGLVMPGDSTGSVVVGAGN